MLFLYKVCASVLIVAVLNLQVPAVALAAQAPLADKSEGITKNAPEMLATPEVNKPGGNTWLWWVLGALAVGVAAAAGGGGGGGGGGQTSTSSSGSVNVNW
jgi:hypothetical protein